MAQLSLVCGLLGVLLIPSIAAMICARASLRQSWSRGERGSLIAQAGFLLGGIGLWIWAIILINAFSGQH